MYISYIEESRPPVWSSGQSSWLHTTEIYCASCELRTEFIYTCYVEESRPPLSSVTVPGYRKEIYCASYEVRATGQSSWLQIQTSWVRFPSLPDFLRISGSGTGFTQPREYN
jgi:hypothetical protein